MLESSASKSVGCDALPASGVVRRIDLRDALVGRRVGDYEIERVLAEGGIGVVYAAREASTGCAVALKVVREEHAGDAGIRNRFAREIGYGRRIAHENVARVVGSGTLDDGRPYLAMDLLDAPTLGSLVRARGRLPVAFCLEVADQILAGLEALHAARVVHRDLQPDNVIVARAEDGDGPRAMLIDLGFAQEPGVDGGDGVTPDSPGSLVGTLTFMSPEQATRARAVTEKSDLFSAALLVYYALLAKLPFRGARELDVLVSIVRAAPIPVRRERRDVPLLLDEILMRALAKHPDKRFASAHEMRVALGCVPR